MNKEDTKLLIFGWITTILGIPKDANPDNYNELTDRLYELFESLSEDLVNEIIGDSLPFGVDDMSFAINDAINNHLNQQRIKAKQLLRGK